MKNLNKNIINVPSEIFNRLNAIFSHDPINQIEVEKSMNVGINETLLCQYAKEYISNTLMQQLVVDDLAILQPFVSPKEHSSNDSSFNVFKVEGKFRNFRHDGHSFNGRYKTFLKVPKKDNYNDLSLNEIELDGKICLHVSDVLDSETRETYISRMLKDQNGIIEREIIEDNAIYSNEVHSEVICKTENKVILYEAVFKQENPGDKEIGDVVIRRQHWSLAHFYFKAEHIVPDREMLLKDKSIKNQLFGICAHQVSKIAGGLDKINERKSKLSLVNDVQPLNTSINQLKCRVTGTYDIVKHKLFKALPAISINKSVIKYTISFTVLINIEEGNLYIENNDIQLEKCN